MSTTPAAPSTTGLRIFNVLTGLTTLGIFLQAITAGEFVSQDHREGWIEVHNVIADVTVLVALAAAIVGLIFVRRAHRVLAWGSTGLFILLVVQSSLGHAITDGHQDGWIGVHVPLAFVIFGGTIWISIQGARARRSSAKPA